MKKRILNKELAEVAAQMQSRCSGRGLRRSCAVHFTCGPSQRQYSYGLPKYGITRKDLEEAAKGKK